MKQLILIAVLLGISVVYAISMPEQEMGVYVSVFEYPYSNGYEMLFAENHNDEDAPQPTIIIPQGQEDVDMEEINRIIDEAMERVEKATKDAERRTISIHIDTSGAEKPYLGIVTEDLTLNQAADLGYNKFYGIRITRVVPDSPARAHRLLPDDIIMEIEGQRIPNRRIFSNIVDSYNIGDTVEMKIFRNRQEMEIDFTFGSRHERAVETEITRKPKIDVGSIGGSWIPVWYTPDVDDINELIENLGFSPIDDRGQFLNGGAGKINVGKGLFLGGMGVGYSLERRIQHEVVTGENGLTENVIRRLRYNVGYGGITLEQRIPLSRKLITSAGAMLGWGGTTIEVSQNTGDYDWFTLPQDLDSSVNNYLNLSKNHIFLQPKVELFFRLNNWLSIRGEAGYIISYSYHAGWNVDDAGDIYEVKGSPDTSFDGMTISLGPWFGF